MSKFKNKTHFAKKSSAPKTKNVLALVSKKFSFLKWLDPFTYVDIFIMPHVKKINDSEFVEFAVNVFFALVFAWAIYTILGVLFNNPTPLVIVYSASMENTLFRGDVMGLTKASELDNFGPVVFLNSSIKGVAANEFVSPIYSGTAVSSLVFKEINSPAKEVAINKTGSVVVYSAYPSGLPIIHRAIVKIVALDGNFILTKGDNSITNPTFDQDCGKIDPNFSFAEKECISFYPIPVSEISGRAFFTIPKIGCVKLWLVDDLLSVLSKGSLPRDFKGFC